MDAARGTSPRLIDIPEMIAALRACAGSITVSLFAAVAWQRSSTGSGSLL